jgi:serine/threonine protein kinase
VADEVSSKPRGKGDLSDQPLPLGIGSILDGRFVIERMLGAGGMGYVVLARNVDLDERVAIKLLLPGRADGDGRQRLVREARSTVKIKSEHVVRILDVVNTGPNAPYIVMEYLEGEDLAARLERLGPLDPAEAAEVVLQACEVVGEAHYRGMVHRDLKPSNLFLVDKPGRPRFVKVLDFGISKALDGGSERLTASNALLGSPAYAAPEQLRDSSSIDRRCDIWALGVVLYESVTGAVPFVGSTIADVCRRILEKPAAPPPAGPVPLPEALLAIIDRCLEKEPGHRYDNLSEVASALRELAPLAADKSLGYLSALGPSLPALPKQSGTGPGGMRLAGALARTETVLTAQGQTFDARPDHARRRPVALAIVAFSAAAGLAVFYSARSTHPSATVASETHSPVVPVPSLSARASSVQTPSAALPAVSSVPSAAPSVVPAVASIATASEAPSASVPARPLPRKPRQIPAKPRGKEPAPGAPWVDSR